MLAGEETIECAESLTNESSVRQKTVIKIRNLKKSFGKNHVLRNFSMDLYEGETVAVLGKSGTGKSVLIKCIIGLLEPDEGTIEVLGKNVRDLNEDEKEKLRTEIGFLFQSNALYDSMTVRQNLEFPLRRHLPHLSEPEVDVKVREVLEKVNLLRTIEMMPDELSGGMKKRVALARTLILHPKIMLYDEPTTGLDPITSREISQLINEVQKIYNASGIVISHDMACVKNTSDRIVVLWEGECYASGTYEDLEKNSDPYIKQFFE